MQPRQHARFPALVSLSVLGALCAVYAVTTRPMVPTDLTLARVEEIERLIAAGESGPAVWMAYALNLEQTGDFRHASEAYRRVLELEPYDSKALMARASTLARAGGRTDLLSFMSELAMDDAKLALVIFARPELQRYLEPGSPFVPVLREARIQSSD